MVMVRMILSGNAHVNYDDLDFSDDVVLISFTKQQIQDKTARMDDQNQTSWIKSQHGEDKGDDN